MDVLKENASDATVDETHAIKVKNEVFSCYHFTVTDFNIGDIWHGWYILSCALSAVFSITATVANLLVLAAIRRTPSLHSPSNTLLFGLALADLGVGLLVHPLYFSLIIGKLVRNREVFCEAGIAVEVIANALCIISLLTVTAVSLDRYLALRLHLRYRTRHDQASDNQHWNHLVNRCVFWYVMALHTRDGEIQRNDHNSAMPFSRCLLLCSNLSRGLAGYT